MPPAEIGLNCARKGYARVHFRCKNTESLNVGGRIINRVANTPIPLSLPNIRVADHIGGCLLWLHASVVKRRKRSSAVGAVTTSDPILNSDTLIKLGHV